MNLNQFAVAALFILGACTTSLNVRDTGGGDSHDDVKTLKAPPNTASRATVEPKDLDSKIAPDDLQRELDKTLGEMENLKHQHEQALKELQDRVTKLEEENLKLRAEVAGGGSVVAPGGASKTSDDTVKLLWETGTASLAKGDRARALDSFKTLADTYPKNDLAHPSQVALGMLFYGQQNYKEAAIRFNSAIDRFPKKRNGVSFVEFGIAASVHNMGNKDDAKLFFEELIRKYPKSSSAALARSFLNKKSKLPEDLFKAFPNWLELIR
jgi:TolA-binding protein